MAHQGRPKTILRFVVLLLVAAVLFANQPPQTAAAQEAPTQQASDVQALYIAQPERYDNLADALARSGARLLHSFPTAAIIASGPASLPGEMQALGLARYATTGDLDPAVAASLDGPARMAAAAWQVLLHPPKESLLGAQSAPAIANDAFIAPAPAGLNASALDPTLYQQSEFLIGTVAVNVVLLQNTGAVDPISERWTSAQEQQVFQQVVAGLSWWQALEPRAHLQFIYDDHYSAPLPVSYEPITRPHTDERLWISEAMQDLGYSASSYLTAVRLYNRASRQRYKADWAFTIFVVNSAGDGDNLFSDGYFAYAYIFGPCVVLTSGNDGYGPENLRAVLAHEVGHIFGALDEYAGANVPATAIGGYLGVPNGNSQIGGVINVDSIMRGGLAPYFGNNLDPYAAGQVGWRDSDGDNILDPVDTPITLAVQESQSDSGVALTGTASESPYPSPTRNPISINHIAGARYQVNDGLWHDIPAADGTYDAMLENLTLSLPPAPQGTWTLALQVYDTAGNSSSQSFTISGGTSQSPTTAVQAVAESASSAIQLSGVATCPPEAGTVAAVQYSLDGGAWQSIPATDGSYDQQSEAFAFSITNVAAGNHDVRLRALATYPWVNPTLWQQSVVVEGAQGQTGGRWYVWLPDAVRATTR